MTAGASSRVLAGVDGCHGGWIAIVESRGAVEAVVAKTISDLVANLDSSALVAIDIPIGLTDAGPRACDVAARRLLGAPRASSVFSAPIRPALAATSYDGACRIREAIEGKRISKQAYAIFSKIREVDELLTSRLDLRERIHEVHPEVSFAYWNDKLAIKASKKTSEGAAERERLIDAIWPSVRSELRARLPKGSVLRDDLNDAFAALWTARRIVAGNAILHPIQPGTDGLGLKMEIVA